MRSDIVPGGVFPDYALPDHTGTVRALSEIQGEDPLILTLARGHYCPKEHQQHLELAGVPAEARGGLHADRHDRDRRAPHAAGVPRLGRRAVALPVGPRAHRPEDLDIQEYTDPDNDPMIPHTLVLKPGLVIHSIYNGYWFWGRPSLDDLWRDLRAVTSEIRPDWDLSTPGLRERWESGDLAPFHGWDRWAKKPVRRDVMEHRPPAA